MADDTALATKEVPPLPPAGEAVDEQRLYLTELGFWRNTLAFGGQKDPSTIWNSMVRNDSQAMVYYRELEEKDEDVGNTLDELRMGVLERDRLITPGGKTPAVQKSSLALEIAEFIRQQLDELPNFHAALDCILDAPGYGFSVSEMIFDVSEGQVEIIDVRDCPQELFLFGNRFRPQVGQLQLLPSPWAMEGEPQEEQKYIVCSHRGRARNRMGIPLLRRVFWPSWFKRNVQRLWLQYAEKGPGTVVARYNDQDSEQEKQQAAENARAIAERSSLAVPIGFQYDAELLKGSRPINPDVYTKLYQAMQYNIARRIMGETLTSFGNEGGTGAKAQGEVHADTLQRRTIELCRAVASVVNRQIVRPMVLWNYGPDAPMPEWNLDLEEEEDLVSRLTVDAGLQRMGKEITAAYVVDRYDIPAVDGEPDVLVPNVNAPQVALQSRDVSNFAEGLRALQTAALAEAMTMSPEMTHDHAELDKVTRDLRRRATRVFKTRIVEVVDAAKRGRR